MKTLTLALVLSVSVFAFADPSADPAVRAREVGLDFQMGAQWKLDEDVLRQLNDSLISQRCGVPHDRNTTAPPAACSKPVQIRIFKHVADPKYGLGGNRAYCDLEAPEAAKSSVPLAKDDVFTVSSNSKWGPAPWYYSLPSDALLRRYVLKTKSGIEMNLVCVIKKDAEKVADEPRVVDVGPKAAASATPGAPASSGQK